MSISWKDSSSESSGTISFVCKGGAVLSPSWASRPRSILACNSSASEDGCSSYISSIGIEVSAAEGVMSSPTTSVSICSSISSTTRAAGILSSSTSGIEASAFLRLAAEEVAISNCSLSFVYFLSSSATISFFCDLGISLERTIFSRLLYTE